MLNIYQLRLADFIRKQKELDLLAEGYQWQDNEFRSKFGHQFEFVKTYPLMDTANSKWIIHPNLKLFPPLSTYYANIVKSYWLTLDMRYKNNFKAVSCRAIVIRHLISIIAESQKLLCDISSADWQEFINFCSKYAQPAAQALYGLEFIKLLKSEELIPANLKFGQPFSYSVSLKGKLERKRARLPTQKTIAALGTIFHQKMPKIGEPFDLLTIQREKFALALLALSFAAPNRAAAEYFLLPKQHLGCKTVQSPEGKKEIYFMDWVGSKKFKDHKKHIWNQMEPAVNRALYYLNQVSDPARILARYYEDPEQPVAELFKNTALVAKSISPDKKVTLWELGYLLGFYETYDKLNQGYLNTIEGFPFNTDNDRRLNNFQLMALFNFVNVNTYSRRVSGAYLMPKEIGNEHTLKSIQEAWIQYWRNNSPDFPYRKNTQGKRIRVSNALIVLLGKQQIPGNHFFSNSLFTVSAASLRSCYNIGLKRLFEENGYKDKHYSITPSQPRHYINTLCQEEGLGQELIAYFSGRAKVTHNIHYDHSDDDEKHFRTSMLHGEKSRDIAVITAGQYTELTGRAAADMGVGLCTQDLYQNPCTYLSDFEANCVGCPSSAYCKGDNHAIDLMKRDLIIQEQRLKSAPLQMELSKNILSARWFKLHSNKVSVYKALIELMEDESIPDGSIIRFTEQRDQFAVIDLYDKTRILRTVQLPAPDAALNAKLVEEKAQTSDEEEPTKLNQLLESFGL